MYALIDSNNFFVSCERLFRPDLANRPVVVLSSNDGCVVSRSNEAKALGIPMGAPRFKFRDTFQREGVVAFSANFELYGDISERISSLIASITPRIELYSVDESFLDLHELSLTDYTAWGRAVCRTILQQVGIPVSVGIAPTKTLCKLATHWAKKHPKTGGAFYLEPEPGETRAQRRHELIASGGVEATLERSKESISRRASPSSEKNAFREILALTPVADIWGIGWHLAPKLRAEGILTAADVAQMRPQRAQQLMGIHGRHIVYELNGTSCLPLQQHTKPQHIVSRGRQFGADTSEFATIEAAITTLAAQAATELRREQQLTTHAAVILRTNYHKPGYTKLVRSARFYTPTADTGLICSQLIRSLAGALNPRQQYHKAEVVLYDLVPADSLQTDLFGAVNLPTDERSRLRMQALDAITAKHGHSALRYAAEALSSQWRPRSNLLSPRYTSSWDELPRAELRPSVAASAP